MALLHKTTALRASQSETPWVIGSYYTKKLARETDRWGNIIQSDANVARPLAWNDKSKLDLAIQVRPLSLAEMPVGRDIVKPAPRP